MCNLVYLMVSHKLSNLSLFHFFFFLLLWLEISNALSSRSRLFPLFDQVCLILNKIFNLVIIFFDSRNFVWFFLIILISVVIFLLFMHYFFIYFTYLLAFSLEYYELFIRSLFLWRWFLEIYVCLFFPLLWLCFLFFPCVL